MGSVSFWLQQAVHGDEVSCKWLISGLAGFIVAGGLGGIGWIKDLLKQLNEEKAARFNDLHEHYKKVKDN